MKLEKIPYKDENDLMYHLKDHDIVEACTAYILYNRQGYSCAIAIPSDSGECMILYFDKEGRTTRRDQYSS